MALPSLQLTKLVHRNHREKPFLLGYLKVYTFLNSSLETSWKTWLQTVKAYSVLQQEMCCVLLDFGAVQTLSGSVPLTLQVLGTHFINTCWEFRVCRNPGWSALVCVVYVWVIEVLVCHLLLASFFKVKIIFKKIWHDQSTNLMKINPILYCFTVYFCTGQGAHDLILKLRTVARAPFPTPATVFPKPQP